MPKLDVPHQNSRTHHWDVDQSLNNSYCKIVPFELHTPYKHPLKLLQILSFWGLQVEQVYVPVLWVPDYRRWWVYDGILYQVKQKTGDRGITVENMEKSQHTDFNEDTTNESIAWYSSNVQLWKLDTQKERRNTSWRVWDERTEKHSASFVERK